MRILTAVILLQAATKMKTGNCANFKSKDPTFSSKRVTRVFELAKVLCLFQIIYGQGSKWYTFWVRAQQHTREIEGYRNRPFMAYFENLKILNFLTPIAPHWLVWPKNVIGTKRLLLSQWLFFVFTFLKNVNKQLTYGQFS